MLLNLANNLAIYLGLGIAAVCGGTAMAVWVKLKRPAYRSLCLSTAVLLLADLFCYYLAYVAGLQPGFLPGRLAGLAVLPFVLHNAWQLHSQLKKDGNPHNGDGR